MQPQDSGFDWSHSIAGVIGAALGAISGFVASIWRVARIEPTIRMDFEASLKAAEQRMGQKIETAEQKAEEKLDGLVGQFHEAFAGMRQKINDVELGAERTFVSKRDFEEWRGEYREDMRDLKQSIANIASRQ